MTRFSSFGITMLAVAGLAPVLQAQKIGVVDTSRVMRTSNYAGRILADAQKKRKAYEDELRALDKQIQDMVREQKELTKRGSPEWYQYEVRIATVRTTLDATGKLHAMNRKRDLGRMQLAIRKRLQGALAQLCTKRGIDLVLKTVSVSAELAKALPDAKRQEMHLQANLDSPLLYFSKRVDLTSDAVQLMDVGEKPRPAEASTKANGGAAKKGTAAKKTGGSKKQ